MLNFGISLIEEKTDDLYTVASLNATWLTLCSKRPPAIFTSWYAAFDINTIEAYYQKTNITPAAVYIPRADFNTVSAASIGIFSGNNKVTIQYFQNLFDCTAEEGTAGTILWVNGWKK